ncbi:MAG: zinc dependent phospholipase C family protein [Defluviitaleaceae bacterium]|nr:zinc dependent phospholipase C family protein [Defluviitaleaceae bacterium]
MPGLITHYLGGQAAIESVSPEIRDYVAPMTNLFNLGTQGPDIFFYYIPGFITKRIRGIGSLMHDKDLGLFFLAMADRAKESVADRQSIFAYTAGFLAHYAVDVHSHPYVFAQTHNPPKPVLKEAYRHRHFETSVDVLMLKHMRDKKPAEYKLGQLISPNTPDKKAASAAMATAMREVYNCDINAKDVYKAMGQMAGHTSKLQSKKGKRKALIGGIETFLIRSKVISALIHMQTVSDNVDYLNIEETPWNPPWDSKAISNDCFLTLFNNAIKDAVQMIQALYAYTNDNLSKEELATIIMNRSLKTGNPCQS